MLEISGVTKSYRGSDGSSKIILDEINLEIPKGQFLCLLGASGCGKTTLLRIMAGLTRPDTGRAIIGGRVVERAGQQSSLVFQNYGLLPWRTILGNVEFGLETRGVAVADRQAIARRYIDRVGLTGSEKLFPHQVSGGMQQRTALARAFSKDSKVLLMDEPFAAVDMQTRERLQNELLEIWSTFKVTVIFVTHSIDEAIYLGDRVIVMGANPGRVNADVMTELPRPRNEIENKSSPRFAELQRIVRGALKQEPERVHTVGMGRTTAQEMATQRVAADGAGIEQATAGTPGVSDAGATPELLPPMPATTPTVSERRPSSEFRRGALTRIVSVALTLALWEWYGRGVDPIFMSYPSAIAAALPKMLATGELQAEFLFSLRTLLVGLSIAIVTGTVLGILMGRYRFIDNLLDAQISALYATPTIALIPVLILWFGLGLTSKIVIVFLAAFFPVVINTHSGVRNVSKHLVEFAMAEGANEFQILFKIILPASLPFVMTGIRLAMGRGVVGMVGGEMFTAVSGLGGAIVAYGNAFATDKLFVVIIALALMGVSLTEVVRFMENRFAAWKVTERAS